MFKLIIENIEVTPTTPKNYKALCRGINIIEWLKVNKDDFRRAAVLFDFHEGSLRKKIRKLGYKPSAKNLITREILERAILEHMEFKSIKKTVEATGFHRMSISTGMRRIGYDFVKQQIIGKPVSKVSWANILYGKKLEYREIAA